MFQIEVKLPLIIMLLLLYFYLSSNLILLDISHFKKFISPQGFPLGLNDGHIYTWTDGLRRRDWHDNESIRKDSQRVGKCTKSTE